MDTTTPKTLLYDIAVSKLAFTHSFSDYLFL